VYLLNLIEDREPERKDHHVAELAWVDIDKVDYANALPLVEEIVKEARKVS
jgi:hypothetical protein